MGGASRLVLSRAWLCALLITFVGCRCGDEVNPPPPPEATAPTKLLLHPEAVLLDGAGASHTLTARALDGEGRPVDLATLELEVVSSNPEAVSVTVDGDGRVVVTALKPVGSAFLVARSRRQEGLTSNPVTALAATLRPGVRKVEDARIVFPPPNLLSAPGASAPADISAPEDDGHVRIGSFSDDEVLALFEVRNDESGTPVPVSSAAVLRGPAPELGSLLLASESAPVVGRVVRAEHRDGFSLVQLEHVALTELFSELSVRLGSDALGSVGYVDEEATQQLRQALEVTRPAPECKGNVGYDMAKFSPLDELNVEPVWVYDTDVTEGKLRYWQFKAGARLKAMVGTKIEFKPGEVSPDFTCTLPPKVDVGPFKVPGPLAFYVRFHAVFQPFVKGKATFDAGGLKGTMKVGFEYITPLVYGFEWKEGSGAQFTREEPQGPKFTVKTEGDLFTTDPQMYGFPIKVSASLSAGVSCDIKAVPAALTLSMYLEKWAPLLGKQLSDKFRALELGVMELKLSARLTDTSQWIDRALQEKTDVGGIDTKLVLETELLPGIFKFLKSVTLDVVEVSGGLPDLDVTLWERPALRKENAKKEKTKIRARSGGDSWEDAATTEVTVKSGDTLDVEVTPAPVTDPAQAIFLYRIQPPYPTLLTTLQGNNPAQGSWVVPGNFCDNSKNAETLHVVGYNKLFDTIPTASYLGTVKIKCEEECPNEEMKDPCNCPKRPAGVSCPPDPIPPAIKKARTFRPPPAPGAYVLTGGFEWGTCLGCGWWLLGGRPASSSWGDPHLSTLDGASWTSYHLGEFWLLMERPVETGLRGGLGVQVRHQRLPGFAGWASFNTAVAVRAGNYTFEVRMPRDASGEVLLDSRRELELLINGKPASLYPQTYVVSDDLSFRVAPGNGLEIFYRDPTTLQPVQQPEDAFTHVRIGTRGEGGLLRTGADPDEPVVSIDVSVQTQGDYMGLLGTTDGRGDNEFTTRFGKVLSAPTSEFVNSFRIISSAQSLFTYAPGEGPGTFAVPQTSTLPDASTLGPYLERLRTLLSTTCGLNDTAVAGLDATFLEQLAYELAAGRTEKNLVASGLCGDGQLVPPENQRFISFNFNGKVTAAGRPDIGVGGVRVRIVARELNEVLCDMVTLDDGRYGCGRGQYASAYASLPSVTLEYIVSGRGPERTTTVVLPTPTPDSNITLARDFEATVAAMLDVRGRVKDIAGVPANRALVRFELPFPATVRTNAQGEFQHYLALPDGLRGGTLRLKAVSEEGAYSGSASASFDIAGAGIHPLTLNLDLGNEPGTLPPLYLVPHVNITGTLRNLLVQQAYGQAAPILGTVVRVRQKGAPESLCSTTVSDAAGKWDCGFIVPRGHTGPLLLEVVADGLPSATRELSLAQNEFPGPGQVVVRTLNLTATPTTLVLEGRATRPDSTGLGHVEVQFQALDGTQRTVRTATDGTYRAFLSFPHETAFSGPVAAVARVLGTEDVGVLEVRATDVTQVPAGTLKPLTRDFLFATGTAVLAGRVLNALAEDAPVAGALVRVSTSGRVLCEAETGSKGLYTCNVSSEGGGTLPLTYEVSRRGVGAFTDFEGQPAMLDLSTVPPATVRPVLPTRDLRVSPTTVRVRGVVKDSAGVAVAGAVVGASIHGETVYTPTTVYSAVDGSFTLSVPLDEGRLSGVVHVSASLPLQNGALTGHVERTFQASALHTQVDVPVTLGLNGFLPPGSTSGARLRFTGRVLNGHLAASPIGSARVDIRLGVGGPRVCSVVTSSSGDYDCPALLVPAPLSPADFEYTVHVAGASGSAPVVRGWSFTRSADVETGLRLDLVAKPTTLELRGRVTSDGTSPLANVQVSVMGSGFGTAWTNAQGEYQLVTVLPPSATTFEGTLTATLNGLSSSRAVSGALEAGQLTQRIENLTLSQRRLRLRGTVENTLAPGTQVREAQVELRHDGTPFCITRLLPIARGASEYEFTCPTELVLGDASATTLEWTTRNVHGRRSGTVTLGTQDIPAAGQQAEKRVTLGLAATALAVSGTVRDLQGRPVGGAEVVTAAVGSRARSLTAPDGTYAVALTLPDTLSDSTNGQPAADLAVEVRAGAQVGTLGGLVVVTPGQRTAVVRDMSFTAVTGLSFTGKVVNANADNQPVRNARIRILRDGMDPVLGLLCEAEMNRLPKNLDEYSCQRMVYGEALTSLTVRYQVLYQGTPVRPDIVKTYTVQPGGTLNTLTEQLSATPTTVRVTGTVKDAQGTPMASASVKLQSGQGAAVTTNAQGQYTHVLTLPTGMTHFEDTLVATRESNVTQAPLSVSPLQQWVVNAAQVDLTMQERRIQFRGRISNTFAPMSSLPDLRVRLRVDGALFCEATTNANADGAQNYDCYNQPLIRTTSEAVNVAWEVVGPWGTTTGTRAVAAAELPASGRTAVLQLDGTVSATTLEVSGVVSRGGAPLSGAKVVLRRGSSFYDQVQTTTDDTGRYVLALSYTGQQATEYTAHVSATDTVNDVRVSLSGTLSAGARTQVTRELVIPSTQTGVAAWARSGFGNSSARQSAPPVLGGDAVIVPSTWAINALRVSDGSTLWTAYLGYSTFVRSEIVVDALDNVYVGTDKGTVHSFGPTGTPRWTVSELGYIGALAVGEGVLYVGSGNRVDALRLSDGSRLWTAATRGFVEELILAPEGTLLASTNGYFSGSLDALSSKDGASRWFLQTWGSPAPTPDEHLLTMASDALVKRDLNGAEVWRTPLGEQPRSAAVAADGTAFVALQRELVKVSAAGEVLGRVQVVGPEGSLDASAPVLGADGTVYIGARLSTPVSGGDTALYAFGPDLSPRWSSWSNTGSFAVPTVVNGRVVVEQGTRVVALDTGVAGGMASGGWARMYGDARNTSRAPASSVPRRELVLSGVVGNANKGSSASMPLANVEVELSLASDGRVLMRTQSDAQGRYRLSLVTTDVDPLELRVTARGWGTSSDSLPVSFGAGVAGSVAEQTRELLLPVTTLEVRGTVRSGGTPVVDAPVWLEDSSGTVPDWNYRARTDTGGNYVYHLLYDASVAATDSIELYAEKVSLGLGSARREVTFVHGALTPVTMDLELRNQPQYWSRTIPSAECEHADRTAYEWFAPVAGNGGDIYLRLYCTDRSTNGWYWTFARVSGDGAQVTLATWGGLPYRFFEVPTTPVLDEEGRLYVGGSRLVVLTPELRVLGEYSPPVKSPYVARPAVAMEPDGSVRLVVPVAINTNPVASGAVMSLDFTPLTGAFTPLWSEAIPERPATDAQAVFSSDKEVVYVAARGVVRAFAVAPEETPRVRFTQSLAVAHSYWTNSYVTVVPTPEGDQLRHMLSYHDGVTSLTSSGTVMQGWPFTGARPRPVAPAVAPDGTTYFIDDNDGTLWALNADGSVRWKFLPPLWDELEWGVTRDKRTGRLYVSSYWAVYAVDDMGPAPFLAWTHYEIEDWVVGAPLVTPSGVFVTTGYNVLRAFEH